MGVQRQRDATSNCTMDQINALQMQSACADCICYLKKPKGWFAPFGFFAYGRSYEPLYVISLSITHARQGVSASVDCICAQPFSTWMTSTGCGSASCW